MPPKRSYTINDAPTGVKIIEKIGAFGREVNELERVLKTRKDGIQQHYWVKTGRRVIVTTEGRIGFYGPGYDIAQAIAMTDHIVPKKSYMVIPAREFIKNPWKFGKPGRWIWSDVQS
jgi:hypothetical protein